MPLFGRLLDQLSLYLKIMVGPTSKAIHNIHEQLLSLGFNTYEFVEVNNDVHAIWTNKKVEIVLLTKEGEPAAIKIRNLKTKSSHCALIKDISNYSLPNELLQVIQSPISLDTKTCSYLLPVGISTKIL